MLALYRLCLLFVESRFGTKKKIRVLKLRRFQFFALFRLSLQPLFYFDFLPKNDFLLLSQRNPP